MQNCAEFESAARHQRLAYEEIFEFFKYFFSYATVDIGSLSHTRKLCHRWKAVANHHQWKRVYIHLSTSAHNGENGHTKYGVYMCTLANAQGKKRAINWRRGNEKLDWNKISKTYKKSTVRMKQIDTYTYEIKYTYSPSIRVIAHPHTHTHTN